ncbi:MAG: DUF5103 domain-containing protein [Tannerella sp.]|jgi:hypothetical protein|nr:DUF5103 domain-containing protein [Tannerella sp.]
MKVMNRKYSCLWACLLAGQVVCAQTVYRTEIYTPQIKSLEVTVAGEQISEPFIELNGNRTLEIDFDVLNHTQGRYACSIIHCDADWQKSTLAPIEYMDGFQGMTVDDFAQAFNTTVHYTHFRLFLPNDYIRFKVSGNYALLVYEEDSPNKTVFSVRFSVCESLVGIQAVLTGNTDAGFNKTYQQVSFRIDTRNLPVAYPQTDLKIRVNQNGRTDLEAVDLQPSSLSSRLLTYEHLPGLIFEAGNEYRRIEFLTHRYNGLNIERIRYFDPYYHADVAVDRSRAGQTYLYDQDQNGRFFVRCSGCQHPDVEADYFIVHFAYDSKPFPDGDLYLLGDFLQNRTDGNSRMEYNAETGRYEKALLLKQGYYNYQYVFLPHGATRGELLRTEGSYFQTENEYAITVYYRPMGARYDRIIGRTTIRNAQETL